MNLNSYAFRRELERVPTKFFLSTGFGESDQIGGERTFHAALKECGIENYTLIARSAILPETCFESLERPAMRRGAVVDTIMAKCEGMKGEMITVGLVIGDLYKKNGGKKEGSLVCHLGEKGDRETLETKLKAAITDLFESNYFEVYELRNLRFEISSKKVEKEQGTLVVAMNLFEHEHRFAPSRRGVTRFLGEETQYRPSKYLIAPFLYEGTAIGNKGTSEGPLAILEASAHLENYDIETDSQPSKAGLHTLDPETAIKEPAEMIEAVRERVKSCLNDKKVPILLGGDHTISIGAFHALKERGREFTILQLDAHTALRPSFDGSPYSEACVMSRGLECTDKFVQVGIRSISNRERAILDFDKLFLAIDIKQSQDLWIDDVLEECSEEVYVTIDADVFDPSVAHSGTPVADGLHYEHVLKLLKKLAQTKKVVGIDINNFIPVPGMNGPELTIAKLLYQFIAYMEKFSK